MKISEEAIGKMKIDIRFNPELVIYFGENELGRITCKDIKDLKLFIKRLEASVKYIMEGFKDKEEK